MTAKNFTTPIGRFVQGDLYEPNDKDAEGRPLLIKNGPSAGQPRVEYYCAIAIPKEPNKHWASTTWGAPIWQAGHEFMAQASQIADFAWKVKDGDSTQVGKPFKGRPGRRPCDIEGYAGCWVLSCSSGFPPKVVNSNGSEVITTPGAVKLGYYIQVNANVDGNKSAQKPGVYVNLTMVSLQAYGPEIYTGPDPTAVGFGAGVVLPPGASTTPVGGMPAGAPAAPGMPPAPPGYAAPPVAPAAGPAAPPYAPPPAYAAPPVAPNPAILAPPPMPGAPPVPPAAPQRTMTPKAQGATYASFIAAGWNDQQLVQHGMMLP